MCATELSANCGLIWRKTNICPLNISFLHKFLYSYSKKYENFVSTEKSQFICREKNVLKKEGKYTLNIAYMLII